MTVSTTTRLGITRWTSGSDPFSRSHMDASHLALENKIAAFIQGTSKPLAGAQYLGTFFWNTSSETLSYCDGAAWTDLVAGAGGWGSPVTQAVGDVAAEGTAETSSRSDHKHGMPGWGSPVSVSAAPSAGTEATLAHSDHVHDIASGAIDSSGMFGSGVVTNSALAPNAVDTDEIVADAVTQPKIGPGAVGNTELASNAVSQIKMQDNSVGQAEIIADSVGVSELNSAVYGGTPTTVVPQISGSAGSASTLSRSDHQHGSAAIAPSSLGTSNSEGSSSSFARADHVHDTGDVRTNVVKGGYKHSNLTVNTTMTSRVSETVTLPSGWGSMLVIMWSNAQAIPQSGSPQLETYCKIGSLSGSTSQSGVTATDDAALCASTYSAIVSASSTIAVWARITTGTATGKYVNYTWLAIKAS